MSSSSPTSVSPLVLSCPVRATRGNQHGDGIGLDDDDFADGKHAMTCELIVGIERIVHDDAAGPGALPARLLLSLRGMSPAY